MKSKYIYKFTAPKIESVEETETRNENGQEIKITKKVEKVVEKQCAILNPKRSMLEDGEMFYSCKVSENIKNGLLPQAVLARKINLDNGVLEDDKREAELAEKAKSLVLKSESLAKEISNLEEKLKLDEKNEILSEEIKNKTEQFNKTSDEFYAIQQQRLVIQQVMESLFLNSAETKARNKTILWWVLNLSYVIDGEKEEAFFKGKSFEDKLSSLESLEAGEEEFASYLVKKFSYIISYWYSSGIKKESDFEKSWENFESVDGVQEYHEKINAVKNKAAEAKAPEEKPAEAKPAEEKTAAPA